MKQGEIGEVHLKEVAFTLPPVCVPCPLAHFGQSHEGDNQFGTAQNIDIPRRKFGVPLKRKLATSVSTTSLAVAVGGDVSTTLLIDGSYECFGLFRWARIDVGQ